MVFGQGFGFEGLRVLGVGWVGRCANIETARAYLAYDVLPF